VDVECGLEGKGEDVLTKEVIFDCFALFYTSLHNLSDTMTTFISRQIQASIHEMSDLKEITE
jgi:hypothetical protein